MKLISMTAILICSFYPSSRRPLRRLSSLKDHRSVGYVVDYGYYSAAAKIIEKTFAITMLIKEVPTTASMIMSMKLMAVRKEPTSRLIFLLIGSIPVTIRRTITTAPSSMTSMSLRWREFSPIAISLSSSPAIYKIMRMVIMHSGGLGETNLSPLMEKITRFFMKSR
jgi:hypothetical protein